MKKKLVMIISIACIWVLALMGTYLLASYEEKPFPKEEEEKEEIAGVSLYDTYDQNGLIVKQIEIDDDSYIQISGLKNQTIEKSINKKLKDFYTQNKAKEKSLKEAEICHVSMQEETNFNDILSIEADAYCYNKEGNQIDHQRKGFNFSLKDGKEFAFEDLFTDTSVINSILTRELTYIISCQEEELAASYDEGENPFRDENTTPTDIEEEVWKAIHNLNREDIIFTLSNKYIYVQLENYYLTLLTSRYGQYFAFPNRFRSKESLYKEDIGFKDLPYAIDFKRLLYSQLGYSSDNTFIDITFAANDEDISWEEIQKINSSFQFDKIVKDISSKIDSTDFHYINASGLVTYNEDYHTYYLNNFNIRTCTMDKQYFENTAKEMSYLQKLESTYDPFPLTYYGEDKNIQCTDTTGTRAIVTKANKKIERIEDLFKPGYDYQAVINQRIYKEMGWDEEFISKNKENITYTFSDISVQVNYNGDYLTSLFYEEFDQKELNF